MIAATKIFRFVNLFLAVFSGTVLAITACHFLPSITLYFVALYLIGLIVLGILWWRSQVTGDVPGAVNIPIVFVAMLLGGLSWRI